MERPTREWTSLQPLCKDPHLPWVLRPEATLPPKRGASSANTPSCRGPGAALSSYTQSFISSHTLIKSVLLLFLDAVAETWPTSDVRVLIPGACEYVISRAM